MDAFRRVVTIPIVHDRAVEALSLGAICGAVLCAGVAGGVEAAGAVAVLAVRMCPRRAAGRYRMLRFNGETWTMLGVDAAVTAVDPPVAHLVHRSLVVLEISGPGRSDFLVFTPGATASDDLRRLRVCLRSEGLSR